MASMSGQPTDTEILNRTRILAIAADPILAETYGRLYQGRADVVTTIAAGLAKLRQDPALRIVIADFEMRDAGVNFLKTLHRKFPERAAIVLAKTATPLDEPTLRELGVFRCLEKTRASFDVLEDAIRDAIGLLRVRARTGH
jgi:hypothetical protein